MNLYLPDIYAHAGMQYAIYGGFRGFSCEEDESLFSTVKHVVRDVTNQRNNVLETVMLRVATEKKAQLDFGAVSHTESPISKIAASNEEKNAFLPARLCQGEDYDTLIEVLRLVGFDDSWWERKEDGMTFFTMKAPAGKGLFVGLYLFFLLGLTLFSSSFLLLQIFHLSSSPTTSGRDSTNWQREIKAWTMKSKLRGRLDRQPQFRMLGWGEQRPKPSQIF